MLTRIKRVGARLLKLSKLRPPPNLPPNGGGIIQVLPLIMMALLFTGSAPAYAGFFKLDQDRTDSKALPKEKTPFSSREPVLITADQMDYDQENDVVYASGHVQITQGETIILADSLLYDRPNDQVQAMGHISMLEPSGNVYFADALEFERDLKTGIIYQFKARLSDDAVAVASHAHKVDDNITELFKAAYTPCKCTDSDGKPVDPFWTLKADKITIDQQTNEMIYDNASLDLAGDIPVAYSPYFSHSTPGADNQSGLLTPTFVRSRSLGFEYAQPVYYTIAPDRDVTLTPRYTSKNGLVMEGDYREKFDSGQMDIKGSITNAPNTDATGDPAAGHQIRDNIDANGAFTINQNYDWGFNINRASDDTYLHLYNFSNEPQLTSRIYAEGFNFAGDSTRNYASIEGLSFQGLTGQDNSKVIPVVAPLMNFNWQSDPGMYNSRIGFDANSMLLYRETGDQSRRLSGTAKWEMPYVSDNGQVMEFQTQLRTDMYDVSNVQIPGGTSFNGITGREIPQVSALWHYPFIDRFSSSSLMLEPVVNVTVSPGGGNPIKIPNEDSLLADFTDANLFSPDRYPGLDRVESGPRTSYGLRAQGQVDNKFIDGVIGQEYRMDNDPNFPIANNINSHFSDYVGKVGMTYQPYSLAYRFRLDKDDMNLNRSEVDAGFNQYPINITTSYLATKDDPVVGSRDVITANGALSLTQEWSVVASTSRDLRLDQTVTASSGLTYKNECVTITTMVGKDYTDLLDIKPSLTFWFNVSLKNLD